MRPMRTAVLAALLAVPLGAGAADEGSVGIQSRTENGVPYVSGGVGSDHRGVIAAMSKGHDLKLVFAEQAERGGHRAFVAGVGVRIFAESGKEVFSADDTGPWLLATLPDGSYRVAATLRGRTQEKLVDVAGGRLAQLAFYW
jgi:hypothetical protein